MKLNRKVLKRPAYWIALAVFGLSIWCAWPAITFQTFPHFPFLRGYGGMALMLVARSIVKCIGVDPATAPASEPQTSAKAKTSSGNAARERV